jgi:anti-sigma factor ChrR (cupin superfamily)
MECKDFENNIDAFLDGSLNNDTSNAMEKHAALCTACTRMLRVQRLIITSLNEAETLSAPEHLANTILSTIQPAGAQESENVLAGYEAGLSLFSLADMTPCDCRVFENNVAAFADGSLNNELYTKLEHHRSTCPACARLAEVHLCIIQSLNSADSIKAPKGLADKILIAAKAEMETAKESRYVLHPSFNIDNIISGLIVGVSSAVAAFLLGKDIFLKGMNGLLGISGNLNRITISLLYPVLEKGSHILVVYYLSIFNDLNSLVSPIVTRFEGDLLYLFSGSFNVPYTTLSLPYYLIAGLAAITVSVFIYMNPSESVIFEDF